MLEIPRASSSRSVGGSSRNTSRAGSVCGSGIEEASPTIKVCVRVRPFIKEEYSRDGGQPVRCVDMLTRHKVELWRDASLAAAGVRDESNSRTFEFDRSYWSFNKDDSNFATQATVYEELGKTLLNHAISGFNNCIFAYGQTASGKSHSVLGDMHDSEQRGLLPRIVEGLFQHFSELPEGTTCKCLVSFIEIYNEQIRDLLTPNGYSAMGSNRKSMMKGGGDVKLEVRQHAVLGTYIPGLVESAAGSCNEVLDLIDYGTTIRSVGETAMNQNSSRSHCIFTFKTTVVEPSGQAKMSQTHLVDLAGSERTKRTGATGDRLKEGVAINRSLSTLARVISALAAGDGPAPFRESKLTYILKESLCGNSKTVMMAAISPSAADYDETLSTLKFAQSVKKVQTHAVVNEVNERGIEAQLREELQRLKEQLMQYEAQKDSDAQQLQSAQRRLQEQEDLVNRYGNWDTALAAERRRQVQRRAVTQSDLAHLQETFQQMHRESILKRQAEIVALGKSGSSTSSSSEEWDGVASDTDDSTGGKSQGAVLVCMTSGGADAEELTPQSIQRGTRKLTTTGRTTLGLGGLAATPERAKRVQQALKQLRGVAEEAERLANSLTAPSAQRVRLHPMVVVDPTAARSATIAVAVAPRCDYDDLLDPAATQDEDSLLEWVSDEQLRRRLAWLKEVAASPSATLFAKKEKFSQVGAWTAAAAAVSAETFGLSEAGAGNSDEVARLRSELAGAKLEAAQAKSELEEVRKQLEEAHRERARVSPKLLEFAPRERPSSPRPLPDELLMSPDTPGNIASEIAASFRNALGALDQAQAALNGGARPGSRMIRKQRCEQR